MPSVHQVPSRRSARTRVAAAVVLTAALLAGCRGPVGPAQSEPSVTPAPEASSVVVAPDAVVPDSDGGQASPPAGSPTPTESPAQPSESATPLTGECATLQAAWSSTNQALVNLSPDHPRAFVDSFHNAAAAMASVTPPEAVAADWKVMSDYLARVNDALQNVDVNDATAVQTALSGAVSANDLHNATAAQGRITTFLGADCKAG